MKTVLLLALLNYFGAYQFEDGSYVFVRTWDELGPNQLTYLFEDGRVGPLHAVSQTEFFTGAGLMVQQPETARVTFEKSSNDRITGLIWAGKRAAKQEALFNEEEISFTNNSIRLHGSLVIPKGTGPFPAIVLVHGSGPVTRDFFGPVSYLFARHGIAVLSYDKRGIGKSEGHWMSAGFADYASDAVAGVAFLRSRKEIDPKSIGLWGASQAGWVIPQAVEKDPEIAFVVMLSVAGVTPFEQELQRNKEEMRALKSPDEEIAKTLAALNADLESLRTEEVKQYLQDSLKKLQDEGNQKALDASGPDNPRFLLWYADILDSNPMPSLQKMKCPVLVLYGDLDRTVPIDPNKKILERALQNNPHVTFHVFPKGNHALMLSETGSMKEFPSLTQFVPDLFPVMIRWIQDRF